MLTRKQHLPLIVFVQLKKLTIFSALSPEPLTLEYPESVVEDMEFTDTRFIETQLVSWRNEEKIAESNTYIIFADECYFRQDFPKMPLQDDPQLKVFLSMVPFEHMLSKTFQTQQAAVAVAMSKNLYRPIVQVFDALHFRVTLSLPEFAINPELLKQAKAAEIASKLHAQFDQLKLLSFVSEQEREKKIKADQKIQTGLPQDKKQLILLSGVFAFLVIALIVVYRWSITPDPLPAQPTIAPTTAPAVVPSPTTEPQEIATASVKPDLAQVAAIKVQVLNGSGIPGQADRVRQALQDVGFAQVTTGNNSGGTISRASIVFAPSITAPIRQLVLQAIATVVTAEPIVQEDPEDASGAIKIITSP